MGMGIGRNSVTPGVIAAGTLFGTTVPAITLTAAVGCSTPTRNSAGSYTVTINANIKPAVLSGTATAATVYLKLWALTTLTNVEFTSYVANTGVLTIQIRTATTAAAVDGAAGFELVETAN